MSQNNKVSLIISDIIENGRELEFINKIILFGSQVNKLSKKSDIDIIIIIDDENNRKLITKKIAMTSLNYNMLIHPIILTADEFIKRKNMKNYQQLLSNSKVIYER